MYKLLCQRLIYQNQNALPFTCIYIQQCKKQSYKKEKKSKISNVKKYWFNKYIEYIKNYGTVLEKNFPRTMHAYRIFKVGTSDLIQDVKKFAQIVRKQSIYGSSDLTHEELQLSHTISKDLIRVSPVLLIFAIPFASYIIFPLAYHFPRQLLSSHYWTLQQKLEFMLLDHKKRLKHNKPLFRCMQAELCNIKDPILKAKWNNIIACLGSGTHPRAQDVITCRKLFVDEPYSLDNLKRKHIKELLAIHDVASWIPSQRMKLMERGMLIKCMDAAIQREGGVKKLSNDAIRWALSFRGLNPANMSIESMQNWLEEWFVISNIVDKQTISLLLHSPILLAYNHPSNWILLYN